MGGVLSLLLDLGTLATELSATTGVAMEALLTGEALAALEAEVFNLMTIEGLSAIEALAQLGFTAEQFSNFSLVASMVNQTVAYGTIFQTVSGASALVSAGIHLGLEQRSLVDQNLVGHIAQGLFREVMTNFASGFAIDPIQWKYSLLHAVGKKAGDTAGSIPVNTNLAKLVEESRWHLQTEASQNSGNESGQQIQMYSSPGGAHQTVCADWILPLVLGLSGQASRISS